ncbi:hypothetical protein PFISCL1PPCAC_346, partial [Pristionchus fissidentatus]
KLFATRPAPIRLLTAERDSRRKRRRRETRRKEESAESPEGFPLSPSCLLLTRHMAFPAYSGNAMDAAPTHLEHLTRLTTDNVASRVRKTSIIATIGPSCDSVETIREMIVNGMNIARVNFSHGDRDAHRRRIRMIKEAREAYPEYYVAIALDTKGPEIRTGPVKDHIPVVLKERDGFIVSVDVTGKQYCVQGQIYIDYPLIAEQLDIGQDLFIDDGVICLRVLAKHPEGLHCEVITGGELGSHKGINLPSVRVQLPILSERDEEDIKLGMEEHIDMIFASYVRDKKEVWTVKDLVSESKKPIYVIAKIENQDSLNNIDEIIEAADGILVARGPLGVETPSAKVAIVQKMIVSKCNRNCKPVVIATQMLESMTCNPRATRAECSDVANAVLDGADCVMLSAETAHGKFPVGAVKVMHNICAEAETAYYQRWLLQDLRRFKTDLNQIETMALAAATAVTCMHATAIVLISSSGRSAQICAQFRPPVPIVALCSSKAVARKLHLFRGVLPYYCPETKVGPKMDVIEHTLEMGLEHCKRRGFVQSGDPVVLITGWPNEILSIHSMMQIVHAK